jgi:hypothetical protein
MTAKQSTTAYAAFLSVATPSPTSR